MDLFSFLLLSLSTSFSSLFLVHPFKKSNVEEKNGFFCNCDILNIVFLFKRQLDCKLHFNYRLGKKYRAKVSILLLTDTHTNNNACECIFLLAGFTCDVLVLLQVQFVSSCSEDCEEK